MTGTPCDHCRAGHLVVYASKRIAGGAKLKRFYACWNCGHCPARNTLIVDASAPPKPRTRCSTKLA